MCAIGEEIGSTQLERRTRERLIHKGLLGGVFIEPMINEEWHSKK